MASIVKVDDLRGNTAAGDITITSEGGSATMQLQQGLVKVWMRWDMAASSLEDSFNVSSFTDAATGISQFDYTSSMSNGNYAIAGISGEKTGGGNRGLGVNGNTTAPVSSKMRFYSYNSGWSASDLDLNGANISGDLA